MDYLLVGGHSSSSSCIVLDYQQNWVSSSCARAAGLLPTADTGGLTANSSLRGQTETSGNSISFCHVPNGPGLISLRIAQICRKGSSSPTRLNPNLVGEKSEEVTQSTTAGQQCSKK